MPFGLYYKKSKKGSSNMSHMRNKATSFFLNGGFMTGTDVSIKVMKPYIEKIITKGIKYDETKNLSYYRSISSVLFSKQSIKSFFENIVPFCKSRKGGYLRIVKISEPRKGDASNMSLLEIVK